jgi:4-hydroxy-tetrahydrodipicolinate reductase
MKKLRIGLLGSTGRMGQEITQVISQNKRVSLHYSPLRAEKWSEKKAREVDVWIDFSSPEAMRELFAKVTSTGKAVVSGTTGLSESDKKFLQGQAKKIPVLWSSNMSLGVAVLNEALQAFEAISHFDFQIEEFHHNKKKDKPSGTALTLQENLKKAVKKNLPQPIGIRGGGIFGVHKVYAMSDEEVVMFEHTALNRRVFAKGAVMAAEWLASRKPGLYQIRDVLFGSKK